MSWDRGWRIGNPHIVCLLETKSGENEADDIRTNGRGR